MGAAGGQLFGRKLPEEFSILFIKTKQTTEIDVGGRSLQIPIAVIGSHEDTSICNYRRAPCLAAKCRDPLNIPGLGTVPPACFPVKVARGPVGGQIADFGHIIAARRTSPLGPIAEGGDWVGQQPQTGDDQNTASIRRLHKPSFPGLPTCRVTGAKPRIDVVRAGIASCRQLNL